MTLFTAEDVSLELGTGVLGKKWNGGAKGPRQMFNDIFSPVDTIQKRDRRRQRTTGLDKYYVSPDGR